MESPKVEQLLESYFEGNTTLEQEKDLRNYFTSDKVAPHLEVYVGMFSAFAKAQQETLPQSVQFPSSRRSYSWIAGIAAAIILAVGIVTQTMKQDTYSGTYQSEEVAVLKAKQTLGVMQKIIQQSTAQLATVQEFEKAPAIFLNK